MSTLSASLYVGVQGGAVAHVHRGESSGAPSVHVEIGGLGLWTYEPAAFDALADVLSRAASELRAAREKYAAEQRKATP